MANTFIPNTNAVVSIDDGGGTPQDISNVVDQVGFDVARTNGGFFTFGLSGQQRTPGRAAYTGNLSIRPTIEASEGFDLLNSFFTEETPVARTLTADAPDSQVGSYRYTAEVLPGNAPLLAQDANGDATPTQHAYAVDVDGVVTIAFIV